MLIIIIIRIMIIITITRIKRPKEYRTDDGNMARKSAPIGTLKCNFPPI